MTAATTSRPPLLVALDIDGTTIDHSGALSPAVREAVADVVAAGHHLVISTGRSIVATLPIVRLLQLERGYAVCSNGAVTLALDPTVPSGYRITDTVTFDPRPVLTMLRDQIPDALVAVEDLGVGFKVSAPFPDGELGGDQVVVDWEELVAHPATRVTLRRPDASSEEFMEQVERVGLHEVSYAVGWTAWLDINPEGVSKGSALELVRRTLHVEPADTVAVGDQRNDIEMLTWAARGVAMGQAPDEVKAVADEVTGTVDEDGSSRSCARCSDPAGHGCGHAGEHVRRCRAIVTDDVRHAIEPLTRDLQVHPSRMPDSAVPATDSGIRLGIRPRAPAGDTAVRRSDGVDCHRARPAHHVARQPAAQVTRGPASSADA